MAIGLDLGGGLILVPPGGGGAGSPGGVNGSIQVNDGAGGFGAIGRRAFLIPSIQTTDDATPVAVATVPLSLNTNYRILVEAVGRSTVVGVGAVGDITASVNRIVAKRIAGGAVVVDVQNDITGFTFGENTTPTVNATANGNDVDITVTGGDAATTVVWNFVITIDEV